MMSSPVFCNENESAETNSALPRIKGYQLLGDSIFVRLANQLLGQTPKIIDGTAQLGFCVSGQRIKQLGVKIKERQYVLSEQVIILIGTNDVLVGKPLNKMIEHFNALLLLLRLRGVKDIIILTLPPIPKLALTKSHWEVIMAFNKFLISCKNPLQNNIKVIDAWSEFVKKDLPIFSSTCIPSIANAINLSTISNASSKRKTIFGYSNDHAPKKIKTVPDPTVTEEVGNDISDFCRYLNKMNRLEREKEMFSSEDEGDLYKVKAFIDYQFWRNIKTSLKIEDDTDLLLPSNWPEFSAPASTPIDAPDAANSIEPTDCKSPVIAEYLQSIMKFTNCFLHLDCFELFFYGNKRVDMIHPNVHGLQKIRRLLDIISFSSETETEIEIE